MAARAIPIPARSPPTTSVTSRRGSREWSTRAPTRVTCTPARSPALPAEPATGPSASRRRTVERRSVPRIAALANAREGLHQLLAGIDLVDGAGLAVRRQEVPVRQVL